MTPNCWPASCWGKVIRHRVDGRWLSARIIETEAYYLAEKGSHASLGYTEKRRALFQAMGLSAPWTQRPNAVAKGASARRWRYQT